MKTFLALITRRLSAASIWVGSIAVGLIGTSASTMAADTESLHRTTTDLFARFCNDCHSDGESEGGLDLGSLSDDLVDARTFATWVRIYDRVRAREMPPADAGEFSGDDIAAFESAIGPALVKAGRAQSGTVLRRLNRREFENTINDLFGTQLSLARTLPEDGRSHEFDNIGEGLGMSMVHLQRYLDAVDMVMDASVAMTEGPPESGVKQSSYAESQEGKKFIGDVWRAAEDGATVFFEDYGYPSGMLREATVETAGWYRVRVTGYAYQSQKPITFHVNLTSFQPGSEKPTLGYFAFPPGPPTTIETTWWMEPRSMVEITPWGLVAGQHNERQKRVRDYPGPGLAINHVEIEGPIVDPFPGRGHQLIFADVDRRVIEPRNPKDKLVSWYKPKFEIVSKNPIADARKTFRRIAETAFRRPVDAPEIEPYVDLFQTEMSGGATIEEAIRTGVAAIFCSPDFLYFREPAGWLDDFAVASRLSYFLTRTLPDDRLMAAAKSKRLTTQPAALLEQTRRLLASDQHQRFINEFCDAWLNLRDIEFTSPDQKLYPEYDPFLQYSAIEETRSFFAALIADDLPVRNIVKSDFAYLNNRLAKHYRIGIGEIGPVEGPELRRVSLPPDSVRGGILSQASILKVSANGTNTSPVVRGVWVQERILGNVPPPPPPGIAGVEPDIRGASTLRQLLDKHRDLDSCRSCHSVIDPPGFALECFNPIGGYRERFRSLGEGQKVNLKINDRSVEYRLGPSVDASGQMPDGRSFAGFAEFRDLLASDEDALAKALITKLLTFATGREMGFADREMIERLVTKSKVSGHGVKTMIELVVTSEAFRQK